MIMDILSFIAGFVVSAPLFIFLTFYFLRREYFYKEYKNKCGGNCKCGQK
jgi:hypothetical protein